jgi:hypothetical protein
MFQDVTPAHNLHIFDLDLSLGAGKVISRRLPANDAARRLAWPKRED